MRIYEIKAFAHIIGRGEAVEERKKKYLGAILAVLGGRGRGGGCYTSLSLRPPAPYYRHARYSAYPAARRRCGSSSGTRASSSRCNSRSGILLLLLLLMRLTAC